MNHKSTSKKKYKCINKNHINNKYISKKLVRWRLIKKNKNINLSRKFKGKLLLLSKMLKGSNIWLKTKLRSGRKLFRDENREEFLSKFKYQPNKVNLYLPIREVSLCKFRRKKLKFDKSSSAKEE